jgi:hypothetical protein
LTGGECTEVRKPIQGKIYPPLFLKTKKGDQDGLIHLSGWANTMDVAEEQAMLLSMCWSR